MIGNTTPPAAIPAIAKPTARPRRKANQRESSTVAATGPSNTLAGATSTAKTTSTWVNEVASEMAA